MSLKITVTADQLELDRAAIRSALRQAGREVAQEAQKLVRNSQGSGRTYGTHRASAPGQAPASRSGNLANSLEVKPERGGMSVRVTDDAFYATALEAGAKGGGGRKGSRNKRGKPATARVMEPRPFLSTALTNKEPEIERLLAQKLADAVKKRGR